jgi:hypothetical protein
LEPNPGCQVHFPAGSQISLDDDQETDRYGRSRAIRDLSARVSILTHDEFIALSGWEMKDDLPFRDELNSSIAWYLSREEWIQVKDRARDVICYLSFTERQEWPYSASHWIYYHAIAILLQDRLPDWFQVLLSSRWKNAIEINANEKSGT